MQLSSDAEILWQSGLFHLNLTMVTTWALMAGLSLGSWLITRRLRTDTQISRWQHVLEVVVLGIEQQIQATGLTQARRYLPFIGTLFVFIVVANLCAVLPGYEPPTGSLSTTTALALCVLVAAPWYGIREQGVWGYLRSYLQPTPIMLPTKPIQS